MERRVLKALADAVRSLPNTPIALYMSAELFLRLSLETNLSQTFFSTFGALSGEASAFGIPVRVDNGIPANYVGVEVSSPGGSALRSVSEFISIDLDRYLNPTTVDFGGVYASKITPPTVDLPDDKVLRGVLDILAKYRSTAIEKEYPGAIPTSTTTTNEPEPFKKPEIGYAKASPEPIPLNDYPLIEIVPQPIEKPKVNLRLISLED